MKNVILMTLRKLFKRIFPPSNRDFGIIAAQYPAKFTSLGFKSILQRFHPDKQDFFFMQVGAFDGVTGDPMAAYIQKYHWKGILLEPQTEHYRKLVAHYQGREGLTILNMALSDTDEKRRLYYVRTKDQRLPDWAEQLSSFSKAIITRHEAEIPGIKDLIESKEVSCITFQGIIDRYGLEKIDLLHIDTEGYDFEIIKMIPWMKYHPGIIYYEHKHLSQKDRDDCHLFLIEKGYRISVQQQDTICFFDN